jgi:hypothetical protein
MGRIIETIVRIGRQLTDLLAPPARPAPALVPVRTRTVRRRL